MQDQLVLAVATALAAKGGEAIIAGGSGALARLYRLLRDRFRANDRDTASLDAVVASPDETNRAELVEALTRLLAADPELRARIESIWRAAQPDLSAPGGVINQFSGAAGRVVQARDIQGDVSF